MKYKFVFGICGGIRDIANMLEKLRDMRETSTRISLKIGRENSDIQNSGSDMHENAKSYLNEMKFSTRRFLGSPITNLGRDSPVRSRFVFFAIR